jgi:hypothetical protein
MSSLDLKASATAEPQRTVVMLEGRLDASGVARMSDLLTDALRVGYPLILLDTNKATSSTRTASTVWSRLKPALATPGRRSRCERPPKRVPDLLFLTGLDSAVTTAVNG